LRPFEVTPDYLRNHIDELVDATIADLASELLLMPRGPNFIEYSDFRDAFEVLRRATAGFAVLDSATVLAAFHENSRAFGVLRAILGLTPPEWADLARAERGSDVTQGAARQLDRRCRADPRFVSRASVLTRSRVEDMVAVAVATITQGAPTSVDGVLHRLSKIDTANGVESLRYAANEGVPYAMLLYERYLGRPFAGHRDAVSELVGEVMETAVEDQMRGAGVTYRKTRRAERIPGFGQAPDFCIPDEIQPGAVIEAKIASDDGTARDKVTRIMHLADQRDQRVREGRPHYEVIACIDGRGFRQRRADMAQLILRLEGKVFTAASLDYLVATTRLRDYAAGGA
jgi:hypothetical protein